MNLKSILLFLILICQYIQSTGQVSNTDSLKHWYDSFEVFDKFKKGNYEAACMQFDSILNATNWVGRSGMLFGGKSCQKCKRDSIILKMFTSRNRDIIGDMCRLDWGEVVRADSIYIRFCESNDMVKYYEDRKNISNKRLSDTLVRFLIEDQGDRLDPDYIGSFNKYGYGKLLNHKLNENPKEIHERHVSFVKEIVERFGRMPTKEEVGVYGMNGLEIVMIHSKLEDLRFFIPYVDKNSELYAYLSDKRCVAEGKDQLYGTQGLYCENKSKNLLYPVFDIENLDLRRFRCGIIPIARYIKSINVQDPYEQCEE